MSIEERRQEKERGEGYSKGMTGINFWIQILTSRREGLFRKS
jgi:hypothetical protein